MADLPGLPSTVDLGGAGPQVEGDPLEFMQKHAREAIDSIKKNVICNENEKVEFKKYVLKKLKNNITKFNEIDKKNAVAKAEEEKAAEGEEGAEAEEDPFADIFGDSGGAEADPSTQEKMTIASKFASEIKMFKEKFIKKVRVKKEQMAQKEDEKKMEDILGQLNQM
jgi:hypothetical protein